MEKRGQRRKRVDDKSPRHQVTSYWERTQWPLQSLIFLLPLLVGYEIGAAVFAPEGNQRLPQIYAERMLGQFFNWLGVTGYYLPGVIAVVVLLCQHLVRRDPWRLEPRLYGVMAVESLLLAAPLFVFSIMITRPVPAMHDGGHDVVQLAQNLRGMLLSHPADAATGLDSVTSWKEGLVFSVGAGIYEELVFRLIIIVAAHILLSDLLALPAKWSAAGTIAISAVSFALYHPFDTYAAWQWSSEDWGRFAFYSLAGFYFAAIYVYRGFGIVAATHALYDVMVIATHFRAGA